MFALAMEAVPCRLRGDMKVTTDTNVTWKRRGASPAAIRPRQRTGAAQRVVPERVATRVKQGFSAPDASWFRGESIDYVRGMLLDRRARIYEYLQYDFVSGQIHEHLRGEHNHRLLIWSLLSFEWWLRLFLK